MTISEAQISLQLLAEERVGQLQRERAYRARAEEDAAFARAAAAVQE
jgi:hypothetical protein